MLVGMGLFVSLLGPVIQLTFLGVLSMAQALVPIGVVVAVILVILGIALLRSGT